MGHDGVLNLFRKGGVLFDGALGTMFIAGGLEPGRPPEEWNRTNAPTVRGIHASYLEAGAHVVGTNTFGGTPWRLHSFSLGDDIGELNTAGVRLAREAVADFNRTRDRCTPCNTPAEGHATNKDTRWVALSLGPTGKFLPPVGNATEDEIRTEYTEQIESIRAGYDLVLIETMYDLKEAISGLETAKKLTNVPVAVTMTFNKNPRGYFTVMGNDAAGAIKSLDAAGADIVGANCSITSGEMIGLARVLRDNTARPLLCQPNAGQPDVKDGIPVYNQVPEEFAEDAARLFEIGINAVGGCCGTTPEFIRAVSNRLSPG